MSITKLSPNWACQMAPIHFIKFLLSGGIAEPRSQCCYTYLRSPWIMAEISVCSSHPAIPRSTRIRATWSSRSNHLGASSVRLSSLVGLRQCLWQTRIERFLQRTIGMGYLPPALPDATVLVAEAEIRLLASVVLQPHHVLRPLYPPVWRSDDQACVPVHMTLYILTRTIVTLFQ